MPGREKCLESISANFLGTVQVWRGLSLAREDAGLGLSLLRMERTHRPQSWTGCRGRPPHQKRGGAEACCSELGMAKRRTQRGPSEAFVITAHFWSPRAGQSQAQHSKDDGPSGGTGRESWDRRSPSQAGPRGWCRVRTACPARSLRPAAPWTVAWQKAVPTAVANVFTAIDSLNVAY